MISLDGESDPVYYGSDCASRTLAGRGVKMTGRQIIRAAQDAQQRAADIKRTQADIARLEAMQAAGHERYVIGGVARGALLSECLATSRAHLARLALTQ